MKAKGHTITITLRMDAQASADASLHTLGMITDLGYALEKGIDFQQDYGQALALYELAADLGDTGVLNNLGWMYLNGFGTRPDVPKAITLFEKAAEQGSRDAMVNLGNIYENLNNMTAPFTDFGKACYWYKRAADLGSYKGMFNYANMLHYGRGVRKNYKRAFAYFSEVANFANELERLDIHDYQDEYQDVWFYLGLYCENGFVMGRDYGAAFQYYARGAELGDAYCYTQMGRMYALGLGVAQKPIRAFACYQEAMKRGDVLAKTNVAYCYEVGQGVKADLKEAMRLYREAADEGEPHAMEAVERLGEEHPELVPKGAKRGKRSGGGKPAASPEAPLDERRERARMNISHLDERSDFCKTLMWFLREKDMSNAEVYKRANITKQTFSGLMGYAPKQPKRETVLALAVGLRLNEEELNRLMYAAGYASSKSVPMDKIVHKFIKAEHWDVHAINEKLHAAGCPLLGVKVRG